MSKYPKPSSDLPTEEAPADRAVARADMSATDQLRQAEKEWLGDTPNERGHGSLYQRLTAEQRAYIAALEEQIKVEAQWATACAVMVGAGDKTAAAKKAVEEAAAKIVKS